MMHHCVIHLTADSLPLRFRKPIALLTTMYMMPEGFKEIIVSSIRATVSMARPRAMPMASAPAAAITAMRRASFSRIRLFDIDDATRRAGYCRPATAWQ